MEILEDERELKQKLESIERYLLKTDDYETIDILNEKRKRVDEHLTVIRNEMREYVKNVLE
jgi:hypothetical protein